MAAEPGGTRLADQQFSMMGGLNTISDDIALQPSQLRKATNARLTEYGALTKRGGTRRTSTSALAASPVLNGYTWRKDDGTQQMLVVVNGTLYTATYGTFPITWTAQSGSLSTTASPSFVQFRDGANDVVYIADGGPLNRWDGTTLTTNLANTPNVSDITVHNERLWATGDPSAPDSIFYSAFNNGNTLGYAPSNGGQIIVRTFGDEGVVTQASVGTSLVIFHRRGLSRLTGYGQDDITVAPAAITPDVGVIAAKSVVNVQNTAFFLSERGLYRCSESEVQAVGTVETPDPLLPIIRTLTDTEFAQIRAVYNRATREIWITVPQVGVYLYHTILNAWSGPFNEGYIEPDTTCLFETLTADGLPVVMRGDEDGWVSLCDASGENRDNVSANGTGGTAYTMIAQMRRMYCGDDALAKSLRWGYLNANLRGSSQCRVEWETETVVGSYELPPSTFGLWGVGVWGVGSWAAGASNNYRIPMGGTGFYIDMRVVDSGEGLPVISRMQLETFSLGRR